MPLAAGNADETAQDYQDSKRSKLKRLKEKSVGLSSASAGTSNERVHFKVETTSSVTPTYMIPNGIPGVHRTKCHWRRRKVLRDNIVSRLRTEGPDTASQRTSS